MACWVKRVDGRDFRHDFRPNRYSDCGGVCATVGVGHHHAYFQVSARSCRYGVGLTHTRRGTIQQPFGRSIKRSACIKAFEQHGSADACRRFSLNARLRRIKQGEVQDRDAVAAMGGLQALYVGARGVNSDAVERHAHTRCRVEFDVGRIPNCQLQHCRAVASFEPNTSPLVGATRGIKVVVPKELVANLLGHE